VTHCERVLDLLSDGREHSHHELYALNVVAHSRVAELRGRDYEISQRRVVGAGGEPDYLYQLVSSPRPVALEPPQDQRPGPEEEPLRDAEVQATGAVRASASRSESDRFWAKVEKTDECWLWTAALTSRGYGDFALASRRNISAHRFAYEEANGPVPEGLEIDHTCHNGTGCPGEAACLHRRCVNPDHLEAITHAENIRRGNGPFGEKARQTHCIHGHEFTPENTYVRLNGTRRCRTCKQIRDRQSSSNSGEPMVAGEIPARREATAHETGSPVQLSIFEAAA
jgi:hypothetical protein